MSLISVALLGSLGALSVVVSLMTTTRKSSPTVLASSRATVTLPSAYLFNQISAVNGKLLLSGEVASTASLRSPTCVSAILAPRTLSLGNVTESDCDDPAIYGETAEVINQNLPDSNNATLSISHLERRTGKVWVGAVVMTYGSYSDTRPVTAYGGGRLWIYDNSTTSGTQTLDIDNPRSAELLEVSTSSGQVVDGIEMPKLFRPIMAANSDGLWIGNSIEGGTCQGCAAPEALYFVAPGSNSPVVAIPSTSSVVCWLSGSQDHLWAGIGTTRSGCESQRTMRLDGTTFRAVFDIADHGYHPDTVTGDEREGLWTVQWHLSSLDSPISQEIVRIDPDTGAQRVVATIPASSGTVANGGEALVQGQAAVASGHLYVLEPPFDQKGYLGYSRLVSVALPQHRR